MSDNNVTEAGQSAGQLLRAARTGRGMSIEDVARQLRLSVRQITALEEGDYGKLPSGMFLRGFVRNYARLVQIDAAPLLQSLQQSVPPDPPQTILPQAEKIPFPSNREQMRRNLIIMGVAVALVLPLLIYEIYRGSKETQQPAQPQIQAKTEAEIEAKSGVRQATVPLQLPLPSTPPVAPPDSADRINAANTAQPAAANALQPQSDGLPQDQPIKTTPRASASPDAGKNVLRFTFKEESWVAVRDGRGKTIFSQLNPGGTEQVVYGKPPFSLIVGNATAVRLDYNDQPVDLAPHTSVEVARLILE